MRWLVFAGVLVALLSWSEPASAKCSGPTFVVRSGSPVGRGGPATVTGTRFATGCTLDGGQPSGHSLERIQVHVVQGRKRILVGRGSADARYRFRVTVTIPAEVNPGRAGIEVIAGSGGTTRYEDTRPIVISRASPVDGQPRVAVFRGTIQDVTLKPRDVGPSLLAIAAVVLGVIVLIGVIVRSRSRRASSR